MRLVDYSDSDESADTTNPPTKKQKTSSLVDYSDSSESKDTANPTTKKQKTSSNNHATALPPLPSAFHDLYASTVRISATNDPTLHQGRKRVNPHKIGHWPSHLYIEWHPKPAERELLTTLLSNLEGNLTSSSSFSYSSSPSNLMSITSFLTSDLGAPQPLHISLSRPIVLSTAQKDTFLTALESSIRTSGVPPFELTPSGLEWHRTEESSRSFLVLRVRGREAHEKKSKVDAEEYHHNDNDNRGGIGREDEDEEGTGGKKEEEADSSKPANPQLTTLLDRANALVTAHGQPALYAFARNPNQEDSKGDNKAKDEKDGNKQGDENKAKNKTADNTPADAFHISIAWSFAPPTAELRRLTEEAFLSSAYDRNRSSISNNDGDSTEKTTTETSIRDAVRAMRVRVDGIKAKIGNIVTHIPLPDARNRWNGEGRSRGLFGV
ncbi:U6 snRNA phosphodiesterase Usb1 [Xylaria arbuscula]|nr:U6 snRNA phosphodiesterase Usb1 [Xylaria arbuscula]